MSRKNQHLRRTFKNLNNMKPIRQTICQIYYRIINTKNRKENAHTQRIRDQIFGTEKRLQMLKKSPRFKPYQNGEIKKIDFSKNTLSTQTGTSLTGDLKTVPLTEKNANLVR